MRIGLLSKRFPPDVGGAGSYVLTWAAALSRCGHEVFVITACNPDRSACGVEQSGRLFRLPDFPDFSAGRWSIAALGMKLWPLLDILQADILHAHDLESGWTMALAPAKYRLPPWLMSTHLTPFGSPPRLRVTGWV